MSKRLQVILENEEFIRIRKASKLAKVTLSAWVRNLIRERLTSQSSTPPAEIVQAFRTLQLPASSINHMLDDIERGRQ